MSEKKSRVTKDDRTRNWTFVAYPESVPQNWRDILDEQHIQWIESPLHDKDLNADGEAKKAHWHILVMFEGNKSFEQIKELTEQIHATIPQKCASVKGLVRYMAHLDNPEKVQYDRGAIIGHGGVDVAEYLKPTSSSRYQLIGEMMDFVRDNDIIELEDLAYYARTERFDDWFPLLCDNSAYIMGEFIRSRRNRATSRRVLVDCETGEVYN
ncbi:MAG: replication protein [Lachnospiraceae bacterium]|nr:replication protein [Lachnospiraceae bacterium]